MNEDDKKMKLLEELASFSDWSVLEEIFKLRCGNIKQWLCDLVEDNLSWLSNEDLEEIKRNLEKSKEVVIVEDEKE